MLRQLDLDDLRGARSACKALLQALSQRVHTLAPPDNLVALPASAWQAFPLADGLRAEYKGSKTADAALLATLRGLPSRLKRLHVSASHNSKLATIASQVMSVLYRHHRQQAGGPAAGDEAAAAGGSSQQAEAAEAAAGGEPMALEQLLLEVPISGVQACNLVANLTSLQQLSLRLDCGGYQLYTLRLQPPQALQSLALSIPHSSKARMQLDLDNLCNIAQGLRRLQLACGGNGLLALPALARLAHLQHLHLRDRSAAGQGAAELGDVLCSLTQLRELELPQLECSSALWQRLAAACPGLQRAWFLSLALRDAEPLGLLRLQLHAHTRYAWERPGVAQPLQLEGPAAAQPEGCLERLMPRLQELAVGASGPHAWSAAAAAGHPELQRLQMFWSDHRPAAQAEPLLGDLQLSSWPKLRAVELQLKARSCSKVNDLLGQLAQCAALEELEVVTDAWRGVETVGTEGVQALASGLAGQSLRRASFICCPEPQLATFVPLLAPGLPITELAVEVRLPGLAAVDAALRRVWWEQGCAPAASAELEAAVRRQLPEGLDVQVARASAKRGPTGVPFPGPSWEFEALVGGRCQLRCAGGQRASPWY